MEGGRKGEGGREGVRSEGVREEVGMLGERRERMGRGEDLGRGRARRVD